MLIAEVKVTSSIAEIKLTEDIRRGRRELEQRR